MSDSSTNPTPEEPTNASRAEYLRRLARFALIDDVPAPWGLFTPKNKPMEPGHA